MRAVKSNARKQNVGLTIPQATREARRVVETFMPDVQGVTVESRYSAEPTTLAATIVTHITFPETADASDVAWWAERAPGVIRSTWSTVSITVTRAVA